jgi:acetyl esterase/lipase
MFMKTLLALLAVVSCALPMRASEAPIVLWPDKPPGETKELPPEQDTTKPTDTLIAGRRIIKLANVSNPTITLYAPPPEKRNGTAVLVAPGGGFSILAMDLEGTEVVEWLNSIGVTAVLLKYRVPFRDPDQRWRAAVQDSQRAMSLIRARAKDWNVQKIGMLGFSAGAQAAVRTALLTERVYQPIDAADQLPFRPDFLVLAYLGGVVEKGASKLNPDIKVDAQAPPMFFVHAYDDGVPIDNSLLLYLELKKAGVPAELHAYATGGHGFGLRPTADPCTSWPDRCAEWLKRSGWAGESK